MTSYIVPLKDMQFVLHDVFKAELVWSRFSGIADVDRGLADVILKEGARIAEGVVAPLNLHGHEEGVRWLNGAVITPSGFPEAYREIASNGWVGLSGSDVYGGQNMPKMIGVLFEEMLYSASIAMGLYVTLTSGAALAIEQHASREIKAKYLHKMYDGCWAGAMCLTEAHSGSDLGLIRTKAVSGNDGSYTITGTKIFITGGDQDLTENIIHLVLAKLPDAPAGSKGISLFLVPKIIVNEDGSLGEGNNVSCSAVEKKMGINASATCVLNFDGSKGFLIGEINRGLQCMFTMMNYERLSVGLQGLGAAQAAYQMSTAYAHDRLQGRSPERTVNGSKEADPISVHADVRRMLLVQKAYVEAGRAFAVYVGQQLDISKFSDGDAKARGLTLAELLTPVAKAFLSDKGLEGAVLGQQVFGGHGYIREWGMEQIVRDVRITQIYEGTNGIQAMDLLGRKVVANKGKAVAVLISEIREFSEAQCNSFNMNEFVIPLLTAIDLLESTTAYIINIAARDVSIIGASAHEYLHMVGLSLYSYMWAKMASAILAGESQQGPAFDVAKLHTGRFFNLKLLPEINSLSESIRNGSSSLMEIDLNVY
jgi:alkylation response protein AidB-like acyl-CoA dehydrogenase